MSENHIQTVVVGSGVIGLAIARKFARQGHEVLVLEAEDAGHHHTSARNSQVIHAGIYYTQGSLKAALCVEGRKRLYDFCKTRHIDHNQCGKLIIANDENQLSKLQAICDQGLKNGVDDLTVISGEKAKSLEPNLRALGAILSPSTGVLDVPAYMKALQGEAEEYGAMFAYHAPLHSVRIMDAGFELLIEDVDATQMTCTNLINAAGLGAWEVARQMEGYQSSSIPPQSYVKACYFSLPSAKLPFERLIYPSPDGVSLGVHSIRDISGQVRFGPSVSYLDPPIIDYRHDTPAKQFEDAIRNFWPDLPDGALQPDTCGIRPRITLPRVALADFMIVGPSQHNVPGLVQLFGIESPGLTSSLAIADYVWTLH